MHHKTTAQDFFLNLGVMATLYAAVVSFLTLVFDVINKVLPDALNYPYYDPYTYGVRVSMATLIIVYPLFLWLSRIVTKLMHKDESRREVPVRRWLVYITLFLASTALVIDLIALLNYFLSGEITARFILKVFSVLVVAGIVFWYYLAEIRGKNTARSYVVAAWVSAVLVVALLVTAFAVFGSPANTRKVRLDSRRVSDLQSIQWQVLNQYQQKGTVPASISDLADPISGFVLPVDPETKASYSYTKKSATSFELCATFSAVSENVNPSLRAMKEPVDTDNWAHPAGEHCFDRSIDPELYPVFPKSTPASAPRAL